MYRAGQNPGRVFLRYFFDNAAEGISQLCPLEEAKGGCITCMLTDRIYLLQSPKTVSSPMPTHGIERSSEVR